MDEVYERFLALAQRELSADDVRLLSVGEVPPNAVNVIVAPLRDGRHVVASFGAEPKERSVLARRLAMLVSTFADSMDPAEATGTIRMFPDMKGMRHVAGGTLDEELEALARRAQAVDAVVIDGDSPVIWGRASAVEEARKRPAVLVRDIEDRELVTKEHVATVELHVVKTTRESGPLPEATAPKGNLRVAPPAAESSESGPGLDGEHDSSTTRLSEASDTDSESTLTHRAIAAVRALPSLALLHKGRHLRELSRVTPSYLVLSFSSIYLLCLVFDGEFDELRAERAAQHALPRIERLVLAIPPHDPDPKPTGGVAALRRPRR
jgi:hypothetical protein